MRRSLFASFLLVSMAACGGGSAAPQPDGPITASVLAGNHQVVTAAPSAPMPQRLAVMAVQQPNGQVSARILNRIGDAILPAKAYAQIGLKGAPNKAMCTAAPHPGEQVQHFDLPCYVTDTTGIAYFVPLTDTIAGKPIARIGFGAPGGTVVTDSTQNTIKPDVPADVQVVFGDAQATPLGLVTIPVNGTIDLHRYIRFVMDKYHNYIAPSNIGAITCCGGLADTVSNFTPAYAVRPAGASGLPSAPDATGWIVDPHLSAPGRVQVYLFAGSKVTSGLTVQAQ